MMENNKWMSFKEAQVWNAYREQKEREWWAWHWYGVAPYKPSDLLPTTSNIELNKETLFEWFEKFKTKKDE